MTRLVWIELLKLRSTRFSYGLLAAGAALSILSSAMGAARAGGASVPPLSTSAGLGAVTVVVGFPLLLALVLGITVSSGEFRYGTATLTFLATPERVKVLASKALAAAVAGAAFGLAGGIATTATGLVFAVAKSDPTALSSATLLGHIGGTALAGALLAAVGVGLGSLVRGGQLGAVIGVFIWCLIGESVLDGVYTATGRYLPFTAAASLAGSRVGGAFYAAGAGPGHALSGPAPLPFLAAAALVAGVAVLASALAATTTLPRDIT
jgi:ABC-2 type transport system permease protein